ncbi:MAG TPA: hypothetical protein VFU81_18980 [Thermomicrobiales bacterium]|nr:hypothetical protein [Thermomicrobiales bacterium]
MTEWTQPTGKPSHGRPTLPVADTQFPPGLATVPFACQHGARLFLLVAEAWSWTLAELRFDPVACSYVEIRRAHYAWPREAAGALLGRVLAAGAPAAEHTADRLSRWLDDLSLPSAG